MYISYNWLKRYLPRLEDSDVKVLSEKLSGALAEVEKVVHKGSGLSKIVVGEIKSVKKHPHSKKFAIASVDTGDKIRQIVFAAANSKYVIPKSLYPVCLPGGSIYSGEDLFGQQNIRKIEIKELENEISEGILCSPKELGVYDEKDGISILTSDFKPGDSLMPLLQDQIFEIENKSLTHRPDCFSHRGIAREIAAIMSLQFLDKVDLNLPVKMSDIGMKVVVNDNENCRRFCGVALQSIEVRPSPTWMQVLLSYVGMRPINNIVDISNYIMLDMGYPTHIYDLDKLSTKKLVVRKADTGESANALNGKTYQLDKDMVVIADEKGNVEDIAGIMGGANSEISNTTKNIFIEAASWNMFNIRLTSMKLGLTSEASIRYSKGLDSVGVKEALLNCVALVEDLAQGEVASDLVDIDIEKAQPKIVEFNLKSISRLIGLEIPKDEIIHILELLGIQVANKSDTPIDMVDQTQDAILSLTIPTFRKDLNISQDISEEIARIYGYSHIEPKLPTHSVQPAKINSDSLLVRKVRNLLTTAGLDEIYTYTFTSKDLYDKCSLDYTKLAELKNPLSPELTYFRLHLLPNQMEKIQLNLANYDKFGVFEIGKIIQKDKFDDSQIPLQPRRISGLMVDKDSKSKIFLDMKAKIEFFLTRLHLNPKYKNFDGILDREEKKIFHPYKSAEIYVGDKCVGIMGEIHPIVKSNFGYERLQIAAFDIDYDLVKELSGSKSLTVQPVINNQIIKRDLNIWVEDKVEIGNLIDSIKSESLEYLTDVQLVDKYISDKGKKSITLRFIIENNSDKNIAESEINKILTKISGLLKTKFGLKIRK